MCVLVICGLVVLWQVMVKSGTGIGHEKQINISELLNDAGMRRRSMTSP